MKAVLLGTGDDALGFGLAGTTAFTAATRRDVEEHVQRITSTIEDPIIIFSHHAAELIDDQIHAWARRGSGPMFVVLPEEQPCR